jgi:hypothetical protein
LGPPGCAAHACQHGPSAGHPSLAKLAQGTVCKILAEQEVKPHRVRCYLEKRDPEFDPKMAEILCVYRQVAMLREQAESAQSQDQDNGAGGTLAIVSYQTRTQGTPDGLHRRCQSPASRPHLALPNR